MSNDLQLNDAVRVKDTCEHEHWRGFVGYVFDLGNTDGDGKLVYTTDGHIGVCFDMDNTHRAPRGFLADDLEKVGDYETFARFSLGYAVTNAERFSDGFDLMKLAYQTWNKVAGNTWVDSKVLQLHEFLEEKYAIRIPRPWDDIPSRFEDLLQSVIAGEFKDKSSAEFSEAVREVSPLREDLHNQLWTLLRNTYPDALDGNKAFFLRKYVNTWRAMVTDVHRDPQPKPGELAAV
jgi:hypothetical protein